jgi:uncharacterized protein (DUF342 family)
MKAVKIDILNTQKNVDNLCDVTSNGINSVVSSLNDFINYSNLQLKGAIWDALRSKMLLYCDCLEYIKKVCEVLHGNSNTSNMAMLNYLAPYDSLDDGKLEEIEEQIEKLKQSVKKLNDMMYEQVLVTDILGKEIGESKEHYIFKFSDRERSFFSTEAIAMEEEIKKLEALLNRIEGLREKDRELFKNFSESISNFNIEEKLNELLTGE